MQQYTPAPKVTAELYFLRPFSLQLIDKIEGNFVFVAQTLATSFGKQGFFYCYLETQI